MTDSMQDVILHMECSGHQEIFGINLIMHTGATNDTLQLLN